MKKCNYHVVERAGEWAVLKEGNSRVSAKTQTQAEAIKIAEARAKEDKVDTKIHGRDGKIRAGNSYGSDPCPPKDKK